MPDLRLSEPTEEQATDKIFDALWKSQDIVQPDRIDHQSIKVYVRGEPFTVRVYKAGNIWEPIT